MSCWLMSPESGRTVAHVFQAAQNVVVELQYRTQTLASGAVSSAGIQKSIYVGWTGLPSKSTVEIDATFAKLVGLSEGQKVAILLHLDPPVAHTVNIEPLTPGDWEIIELHATFLELNLLSQVRSLPNPAYSPTASVQAEYSHPLTLHLSPTSTANIIVTSVLPPIPNTSPFTKIAPDAEVIVAPKVRPKSGRGVRGDARSVASRRSGKSGVSTARPRSSQKAPDRGK